MLRVAALAGLMMVSPPAMAEAAAAEATACESACVGGWAVCRFATFPNPYGGEFCDGYLYGCLLGCQANL